VIQGFAPHVSSPKGFVNIAEGVSLAASMWCHQAAAGIEPSATATKAGTQRVPGSLFAKTVHHPASALAPARPAWYPSLP
jgi:hypothetical protein